ncbi:MAG: PEP-CTERM sorting domain-containing protein [Candidatus Acidiferrales bacterium]
MKLSPVECSSRITARLLTTSAIALGMLLVLAFVNCPAARADNLSGVTLSGDGSTGGFFFAPGTNAGDLSMTITGCPSSQPSGCLSDAGISGSTSIDGTAFTWELLPTSADFTPCAGTSDCWDFSSTTTGTGDWLISPTGDNTCQLCSGGGLILWSSLADANGAITLSGTATGTDPTGASVDDPFSVTLGALTCTSTTGTAPNPCTLSDVADSDPIYGTASLSSGQFGSTPPPVSTPEPGTLALLGLGLFSLAVVSRRRTLLAGRLHREADLA